MPQSLTGESYSQQQHLSSPNVISDGLVSGSALGILDANPRWIEICTSNGALFLGKVEGVCALKQSDRQLFAIVDADDPELPCELCEVELVGAW